MKSKQTAFLSSSILALFFMVLVTACDKKDDNNTPADDIWKINATMSGANEFPNPITTSGTGTVTGTYNATTNLLTYSASWSGLTGTASAGHFHSPALPGANANPLVFFLLQNNGSAGTASGSATLSETQEADLLAGKFYANIHTATNSGGEIRGQVATSR